MFKSAGMKILLLDKETMPIISLVSSRHELLDHQVFLHQLLGDSGLKPMKYMKAIIFVRPTRENIDKIKAELHLSNYRSYQIYFSNVLRQDWLKDLAIADKKKIVESVQEYYGDFHAINRHLFTINIPDSMLACVDHYRERGSCVKRCTQGIASFLLSTKQFPIIRYSRGSTITKEIADSVSSFIQDQNQVDNLFYCGNSTRRPTLLILDRKDDSVTPLLTQWTYQAMVHQAVGINLNRVDLTDCPDFTQKEKEIVLSETEDEFFAQHMHANWGDLCTAVKTMMDKFQSMHKTTSNISSIDDMKAFVENYPEFQAKSNNVSKHVSMVSVLSKYIKTQNLLAVSATEQDIANADKHTEHLRMVEKVLGEAQTRPRMAESALRVVLLYALRYETNRKNQISQFCRALEELGQDSSLVKTLLMFGGTGRRHGDLFGGKNLLTKFVRQTVRDMKGVENVFTEHQCLLDKTLEALCGGRLKEADFPYLGKPATTAPVREVVVFIVGGYTYEEAAAVARRNAAGGARVILGGTEVLNISMFLKGLEKIRSLS